MPKKIGEQKIKKEKPKKIKTRDAKPQKVKKKKENDFSLEEYMDEHFSKKTQKALLYVLGIAMVAIVYLYVFTPMQESNEATKTTIASMEQEVTVLKGMEAKMDENRSETQRLNQEVNAILQNYSRDVKQEEMVVEVIHLEDISDLQLIEMGFNPTNLVMSDVPQNSTTDADTDTTDTTTDTTSDGTVSSASNPYQLFVTPVTVDFKVSYEGLKTMFADVQNTTTMKKNIENIALSYDSESGLLMGNLTMNFYSLQGEDAQDNVEVIIPETGKGTSNIFHTVE
jgi:type II secretory pathway component PulM